MPKDWDLTKAIKEEKDYKSNVVRRDTNSRKFIEDNYKMDTKTSIMPGQMVMFNYLEPKTKEDLKYYDAMPCTLFFNTIQTEDGPRVLGWNAHYYPPKIRWQVFQRVWEIFKPLYEEAWNKPLDKEMQFMNYHMLLQQLQKAKLDFGVRMYIPSLITKIYPIPLEAWPKALLTEGVFKKETRAQILSYWKAKAEGGITKPKTVVVGKDGKKHKVKSK